MSENLLLVTKSLLHEFPLIKLQYANFLKHKQQRDLKFQMSNFKC